MAESSESEIHYDTQTPISVPSKESEQRFAIRKADWKRIRRQLESVNKPLEMLPVIYSASFGIAGSSILAVLPIWDSTDIKPWVIPAYLFSFLASLALGIILVILDKKLDHSEACAADLILKDMDEIEESYKSSDN